MFLYVYWFEKIKEDIKNKYNIDNPQFIVNEKKLANTDEILRWIKATLIPSFKWIFYKKTSNNTFELKPFLPNPSSVICNSMIFNFLKNLTKNENVILFTISYTNFSEIQGELVVVGESVYDEKEISKELSYLFKTGKSKISFFKDPSKTDNKIIYHLFVTEDTLPNMLKSGYLQLEYSDC
jgi:hypothetical protein